MSWRIQRCTQCFSVSWTVFKHNDNSTLRCPAVLKAWRTALLQGMMPFAKDSCSTASPHISKKQKGATMSRESNRRIIRNILWGLWLSAVHRLTMWVMTSPKQQVQMRRLRQGWGAVREAYRKRRTARDTFVKAPLLKVSTKLRSYSCTHMLLCLVPFCHLFHVFEFPDYPAGNSLFA